MTSTDCTNAIRTLLKNTESAVESVAKMDGDGVLVRVSKASEGLVRRLKDDFPLASVALAEDLLGSTASAHVLFPDKTTQQQTALDMAFKLRSSRILAGMRNAFLLLAAFVFVATTAVGMGQK